MGTKAQLIDSIRSYVEGAGVPASEFDAEFVERMIAAMMVSFFKYGRVADAYPAQFSASADMRTRLSKYRETGNKHFLVDVANFAMIEAMHPSRDDAIWGANDADNSPGRNSKHSGLVQQTNDGSRILGETILHRPDDSPSPLPTGE